MGCERVFSDQLPASATTDPGWSRCWTTPAPATRSWWWRWAGSAGC
ncbi:MAG: hypothetical protein M3Z25_15525 [Actinomycetota bacterium]|nr:hypothetical protein [Actinomycetota bacterium]